MNWLEALMPLVQGVGLAVIIVLVVVVPVIGLFALIVRTAASYWRLEE